MSIDSQIEVILLLDNIRSMYNVGAIFRTAEGLGVTKIILCGITPTPPRKEIHKTALGAELRIAWEYAESTEEVATRLKKAGFLIVALEITADAIPLRQFSTKHNLCLIVGHETNGVEQNLLKLANETIYIPMYGEVKSLNVASATAIACWHLLNPMR